MRKIFTNVKSYFFLLTILTASLHISAQNVGVNTTGATPDVSAMLDVANANKGLLIPRVSLTSTIDNATIATPATSLLVFNTNTSMTNGQGIGYYYNSGTTASPLWVKLSQANEAWLLNGNTGITTPAVPATYGTTNIGTSENFLGTKDANDVVFGTDNIERFRIKQTTGNVGVGTAAPAYKLDIVAPGSTLGVRILSGNNAQLTYLSLGRTAEYAQIGATTAGTFFTDAATGDMAVKNFNSGKLLLGASYFGTADMAITPTYGNVGVKTVTPNSRLDVNGDLALREGTGIALANTTYPTIALTAGSEFSHYRLTGPTIPFWLYYITGGNDGQVLTLINTTGQPMNIYNWNTTNGIVTGTGNHLTSNAVDNSSVTMIFNASLQRWIVTSYTGMSDNEAWNIDGNAGTNDPATPGTYGTTAIATNENWAGTRDANDYVIGTNNIERFRVKQTTGDVGIGLSAPSAKLHVYTTGTGQRIELPSGTSDGLQVWHYGTGRPIYAYTAGGSDGIYSYSANGNGVYGYSNGAGNGLRAYSYSGTGVYSTTGGYGTGVYGYSPYGYGVYGNSYSNLGVYGYSSTSTAVYAYSGSAGTIAVGAYQNGIGPNIAYATNGWSINPVAGTGVATGGDNIGINARANYDGNGQDKLSGLFCSSSSSAVVSVAAVGSVVDGTVYKIVGFGTVSTLVRDNENKERVMVAPEAPEALFQDYGTGKLENGKSIIKIDPVLTKNIRVDEQHPMKVFVQLEGNCKGVYVTNKTATGFEVIELDNGSSNTPFSYQIVAFRADEDRGGNVSHYSDMRFKPLKATFTIDNSQNPKITAPVPVEEPKPVLPTPTN